MKARLKPKEKLIPILDKDDEFIIKTLKENLLSVSYEKDKLLEENRTLTQTISEQLKEIAELKEEESSTIKEFIEENQKLSEENDYLRNPMDAEIRETPFLDHINNFSSPCVIPTKSDSIRKLELILKIVEALG